MVKLEGRISTQASTAQAKIDERLSSTINSRQTLTANIGGQVNQEIDPTVPSYVKSITEEDIENWNSSYENITEHVQFTSAEILEMWNSV